MAIEILARKFKVFKNAMDSLDEIFWGTKLRKCIALSPLIHVSLLQVLCSSVFGNCFLNTVEAT